MFEGKWLIADIAKLVVNYGYAITVCEETILTGATDLDGILLFQSVIDRNVHGFLWQDDHWRLDVHRLPGNCHFRFHQNCTRHDCLRCSIEMRLKALYSSVNVNDSHGKIILY